MGWDAPILTDSGGFQAYSLIRQNAKFGSMNDKGITFQPEGSDRKFHLTPEKSVQLQLSYGADILVCLDDCTHVDDAPALSLERVRARIDSATALEKGARSQARFCPVCAYRRGKAAHAAFELTRHSGRRRRVRRPATGLAVSSDVPLPQAARQPRDHEES